MHTSVIGQLHFVERRRCSSCQAFGLLSTTSVLDRLEYNVTDVERTMQKCSVWVVVMYDEFEDWRGIERPFCSSRWFQSVLWQGRDKQYVHFSCFARARQSCGS